YILVDEFQDTNHAQYELVKKLTLPEGNICVVGDDDQSIYGFRGARVENILNFSSDYKNTRIIRLEQNYRSYQTILSASSSLINHNPGRLGKTLYTRKGTGEKIKFYLARSDYGEADYIAQQIRTLVFQGRYNYSDIAVFYRTNAQSRVFESVFSRNRTPYTIVGGQRFYEREEVKDMLSYLRLAINPMDEISLGRIISRPPRGIGKKSVQALIHNTISRNKPFYEPDGGLDISSTRSRSISEFCEFFKNLAAKLDNTYPPQLLRFIYENSGYLKWLQTHNKDEKIRNLEELYNAVEEFSRANPSSSISDFIEEVSLDQGATREDFQDHSVYLITLHNAKGLEFPVVFIAGMEEGVFPHFLSEETPQDLQEERRLCYVGMTRAMEVLYLTAARTRKLYGRNIDRDVSDFVEEIPAELLEVDEERAPRFAGSGSYLKGSGGAGRMPFNRHSDRQKSLTPREIEHLEINTRVVHEQFGKGKVVSIEKQKGVAVIEFDDGSVMKFMLEYTPIKKE
ncbi:MAG: ATP-dependent helicase, partial [Spirochaetota bacterium]